MSPEQSILLKGALKSAVSAACGVIIANMATASGTEFTLPWLKTVAIQTGVVVLVCEARFWKQWAESGAPPTP